MAYERPSLSTLVSRIAADLAGALEGVDGQLRRANVRILSVTLAGAVHLLYGFLTWLARQLMPDTAEKAHLRRWASIWGIEPLPAFPAVGSATFSAADGSEVEAGRILQRADQVRFTVTGAQTAAGGVVTVSLEAEVAGAAGNTEAGTALVFTSPVAGVATSGTVDAGGLQGGTDAEGDDALKARLLQRIQEPPQGGNPGDYRRWALTAPGVTRVWPYENWMGLGTVGVTFVLDGEADLIPNAAKVAEVAAAIAAQRPVTAEVFTFAPVAAPLNPTIRLSPDTAATRAAVVAELEALIRRESEPGGILLISHLREAISTAEGEWDHTLISPAADILRAPGQLSTLGTVTWV